MTFPCKEELMEFEAMDVRQDRIYPDSCDYGLTLGSLSEATLDQMRINLNEMLKVFKKPEYFYHAENTPERRSVQFFIPIERDSDVVHGINFSLMFHRDPKVDGGGYIQIDIMRITH